MCNSIYENLDKGNNNNAMGKVTAIRQQQRNPERVNIFIGGVYSFSLHLDQLLESALKKDDDLSKEDIDRFKKISEEGKLKARALEWVLRRPHSVSEFRTYCFKKGIDTVLQQSMLSDFIEKKYLDDVHFARWFAEGRLKKHASLRSLAAELRQKGVANETISEILGDVKSNDIAALAALIEKLQRKSRYKNDLQKLKVYLVSKGFSYDDIKRAFIDT